MPLQLTMSFDGGAKEYTRILDKGAEKIENLSGFFKEVVQYLEGKNEQFKSPILTIYEEEGAPIGGNWEVSPAYAVWKSEWWQKERLYSVPIK